ncbi:unnamed protein product [Ectocarpus sp. 6 AP-2014]
MAFEKTCTDIAACEQSSDHEPCLEDRGGVTPQGNPPQAEEVSDAMVAGLNNGLFDFGQLQKAVDRRPNIRTGIGGLIINMRHLAHGILGAPATIDDSRARGLYNQLQDVYNRFCPHAYLPAPPLEKWRGISTFCDHFQCRVDEGIIASQAMSAFSTPPVCLRYYSNYAGSPTKRKQGGSQIAVEERHDSMVLAGVIPGNATGAMMAAPCSNGDRPIASTSLWELHQDPAARTDPPAGPGASLVHKSTVSRLGQAEVILTCIIVRLRGPVSGWLAHVPDMSLRSPELREVDGGAEETWDDKIPAADWVDVTHAMLGAIDDDGPAL